MIINPNLQPDILQFLQNNVPELKEIVIPEFSSSSGGEYPKLAFKEVGETGNGRIRYMFVVRANTIKEATEIARKIEKELVENFENEKVKWIDIDGGFNQTIDEKSGLKEVMFYLLFYTADSV